MPKQPTGNPLGRPKGTPNLLTPEVTKAICNQLEIAVPDKWAAQSNGISEQLYHRWMRLGEAGEKPYDDFFFAVSRAKAQCIANLHEKGLEGGKGSSAALWMLERRFWREYAAHQRVEITPPDPLSAINESELEEAIAAQRKRLAEYDRVRSIVSNARALPEAIEE